MPLIDRTSRTIRRHQLVQPGDRVVVAVSGGADSVALLHVLRHLQRDEQFELAGAAHFNHMLRGASSDADEAFCRRLAAGLSLPIQVESGDVRGLARATGASLEQAAHDTRHAFFSRAAERLNARHVAVAHTRDDQAETFLLRLLRGAGPRGLGGMHHRSGIVIRPFLDAPRSDVRQFLSEQNIEHREDASNVDPRIPRNRIRHELIPFLEQRFSAGIIDVLDRDAAIARDDAEYLDAAAARAAAGIVVSTADRVEIRIAPLLAEPPAIARRVVRDAQRLASGGKSAGFDAVEAVFFLAVSNSPGPLDLPGHRVNRVGETLVLTRKAGRAAPNAHDALFAYGLNVPGVVSVPEAACAIWAETHTVASGDAAGRWPLIGRGDEVVIEARRLAGPLVVRSRRPGDRFRPLGFRGRKSLQDFFVDAKIARNKRDRIPVVVDAEGRIVWVAGLSVAEDFRVTDLTTAVVILKRVPAA